MNIKLIHLTLCSIFLLLCQNSLAQEQITSFFELARQFSENGKDDSARITQQHALELLLQLEDKSVIGQTLLKEGKECEQKGYYTLGLIYYLEGIKVCKETGNDLEQGVGFLGLSNINFRIGNNTKALAHSIEAAKVFKHINDTTHYISASMHMAQTYLILNKFDEALGIYEEMLVLANELMDSTQIADNLDHIGVVNSFKKQFDQALPYHQQALKINIRIGNAINQSINYANIGEIYLRKQLYDEALIYLKSGLKIATENDFRSLQIFIYYTLGEVYSMLGQEERALSHFNHSLRIISELGEKSERPNVYQLLSQHYEREHDFDQALAYYKRYNLESDSLVSLNIENRTEELKILYEMEQREQELKSVTLENVLKQNELDNSNNMIKLQFVILGLVLLGMIFSSFFVYYFYRSQRKLKQANNTKDVLFSIIGHDLRGPVGNIQALTALLLSASDAEKKQLVEMLNTSSTAALDLLNELLDWSKSINNKIDFHPKNFILLDIVNKALKVLEIQAKNKGISLSTEIPESLIVVADVNHIYTVIRNLVSNAIKFTPTDGSISIQTEERGGDILIKVKDSGVGMDSQSLKRIMNKNTVLSTYGTDNEKGSGLGLLLCQEFLKVNSSTLNAKSAPGKGSTFSFTLPKGITSAQ